MNAQLWPFAAHQSRTFSRAARNAALFPADLRPSASLVASGVPILSSDSITSAPAVSENELAPGDKVTAFALHASLSSVASSFAVVVGAEVAADSDEPPQPAASTTTSASEAIPSVCFLSMHVTLRGAV